MKINFGRIFEQSLIPDQPREQLAPFIEWAQQAIDNLARALTNSLTIADNLDAQILNQTIRSTAAATSVEFRTRKVPEALLIAQQSPTTPVISSYAWQVLPNGNVKADITFSAAPTNGVSVRFIAFFG